MYFYNSAKRCIVRLAETCHNDKSIMQQNLSCEK